MLMIKVFFVFTTCLILALLNVFRASDPNQNNSEISKENNHQSDLTNNLNEKSSNDFTHYFRLIQNNSIDKEKIQTDINSLKSKFEREYLTALLNKRAGNFNESFDRLYSLLADFPDQPNYYEELASLAKISGKLDKLSQWLIQNKTKSDNPYYLYLEAFVEIQAGKISSAIKKFDLLSIGLCLSHNWKL